VNNKLHINQQLPERTIPMKASYFNLYEEKTVFAKITNKAVSLLLISASVLYINMIAGMLQKSVKGMFSVKDTRKSLLD
jgi:hypothetical protein